MQPEPQPPPESARPGSGAPVPAKIEPPKSNIERLLAYRRFWICAVVALIADQWSKSWIIDRLPFNSYPPRGGIEIFPNFFYLVHVGNTGAAWSMFSGQSTVLGIIALLTLGAIFLWRRALGLRAPWPQFCFGLLCGGTVGNLIDRFRHNHVTDFLDFHFGNYIYPTFNVADAAIFVGVFGYLAWSFRQPAAPDAS